SARKTPQANPPLGAPLLACALLLVCPLAAGAVPAAGTMDAYRGEGELMQRTIAEKISCTGIGLHSGHPVQLTLHPARAGAGVVFVRTDLSQPVEVPAIHSAVTSTRLATTLGRGDATVGT